MTVALIVPFQPGNPTREKVWRWVETRLGMLHPEWRGLLAASTENWTKARAVNNAAKQAIRGDKDVDALWAKLGYGPTPAPDAVDTPADILVVMDADVVIAPAALRAAVKAVEGGAAWSVPHDRVYRLNPDATERVLDSSPGAAMTKPSHSYLERPPYVGLPGGGLFVVSRASWKLVGGFDERFKGWGSEDFALGVALDTLAGQHHRGTSPLLHLYHPRADRTDQVDRNQALEARYAEASGKPEAMRKLIDERPKTG